MSVSSTLGDQPRSENSTPPSGPFSGSDSASSSQVSPLERSAKRTTSLAVRLKAPLSPLTQLKSAASSSSTLDGLPEELLDQVISYLDATQDFFHLCKIGPRYYRAASPGLYREFYHEFYTTPKKLHNFLRTLINKPGLAASVSYINLKEQQSGKSFWDLKSWQEWAIKWYNPQIEARDRKLFLEAAKELRLHRVDALETIAAREEAQAALLLSRTTNLEELSMTIPHLVDNLLLLEILRETTDQGTALQNLRKFNGEYYNFDGDAQGGFELAPISSLFRLPKIETVHAVACLEPENDAFKGFDCPQGSSSVTDIEFRRSSVCPKAMSLMLGAPRALKRFYCDWGGHTVGWSEINFPTVGAALRLQQDSLESLTLDVKKHYHTWPEAEDVLIPPLGSFAGFKQLKIIEAPGSALIGWDEQGVDGCPELHEILPPSIKFLTINQWTPGIYEHLERLSDVVVASFPDLVEIALEGAPDDVIDEKLQELFESNGAHVAIRISDGDEVDHFD